MSFRKKVLRKFTSSGFAVTIGEITHVDGHRYEDGRIYVWVCGIFVYLLGFDSVKEAVVFAKASAKRLHQNTRG